MVFAHTGMKLSLLLSSKTGRGRSEKGRIRPYSGTEWVISLIRRSKLGQKSDKSYASIVAKAAFFSFRLGKRQKLAQ